MLAMKRKSRNGGSIECEQLSAEQLSAELNAAERD
jgi:hypothetical protein